MQQPSSTVAMSAYNVIAAAGGPLSMTALRLMLGFRTEDEPRAALVEMQRRGWVDLTEDGWNVRDKKRRLARVRDLSDAETTASGEVRGGWNGWLVQCAQRGMLTIEDAIAEGTVRL